MIYNIYSAELKLPPHFTECKYKQHNQTLPQKVYPRVQRQSAKHDNSSHLCANLKPSRKARKRNLGKSHSRRDPLLQGWLGVMQVRLGAGCALSLCVWWGSVWWVEGTFWGPGRRVPGAAAGMETAVGWEPVLGVKGAAGSLALPTYVLPLNFNFASVLGLDLRYAFQILEIDFLFLF